MPMKIKYDDDGDEDDNDNTDDGDKHDDDDDDDNRNDYNHIVMLISEVVHTSNSSWLPNIFCSRKVASSKGRVFQLPSNNN